MCGWVASAADPIRVLVASAAATLTAPADNKRKTGKILIFSQNQIVAQPSTQRNPISETDRASLLKPKVITLERHLIKRHDETITQKNLWNR